MYRDSIPANLMKGTFKEEVKACFLMTCIAQYTILILQLHNLPSQQISCVQSISKEKPKEKKLCLPRLLEAHNHEKRGEASVFPIAML